MLRLERGLAAASMVRNVYVVPLVIRCIESDGQYASLGTDRRGTKPGGAGPEREAATAASACAFSLSRRSFFVVFLRLRRGSMPMPV